MASWWRKVFSKDTKRKESKDDTIGKIQRKIKSTAENEKCIDKSTRSKGHRTNIVPEKRHKSPVPSRSTSSYQFMTCCRHVKTDTYTDITSNFSSDHFSDIIIDDPLVLYPPGRNYKNQNRTTTQNFINLMHNDQSSTSIQTSSRAFSKPVPLLCNEEPHSLGSQIPTSPSKWKRGRFIGQGAFGQVFVGFNSDSGHMCAMKEVTLCPEDPKSRESVKQLHQEITLLSHLRHPNIVRYYGYEMISDKLYIYLEYVAGGSMYKVLQQYGPFEDPIIRNYTRQILSGLAYLHAEGTVHRDIKGANILVDPHGIVKLADFGVAKDISGDSCPLSLKGSPYWMAPEVIENSNGCNPSVDIWSLGCTIIEMATTKPPWSEYEWVAAMFKIWSTEELPAVPDELSAEGKDFVKLCLQRNPMDRPSAAQLLQHPFVKDANTPLPLHHYQLYAENLYPSFLDSEAAPSYLTRNFRISSGSSNPYLPSNVSYPVSPTMRSQLPLSGNNAILFHQTRHPAFEDEALDAIRRPKIVMSGRMSPIKISSPVTPSRSGSSLASPRTGGSSYAYGTTKTPFNNNDDVLGHYYRQANKEGGSPSKFQFPDHVPQLEIADKVSNVGKFHH